MPYYHSFSLIGDLPLYLTFSLSPSFFLSLSLSGRSKKVWTGMFKSFPRAWHSVGLFLVCRWSACRARPPLTPLNFGRSIARSLARLPARSLQSEHLMRVCNLARRTFSWPCLEAAPLFPGNETLGEERLKKYAVARRTTVGVTL